MTFPVQVHVGNGAVDAHLIFELLSYLLGFQYYRFLRSRQGDFIDDDKRLWVITGAILGAGIFSKTLGFFEHPELLELSKKSLIYLIGSKTVVGGLLGGVIGAEVTKKMIGVKKATGDLFCFPIIIGIIIGRIGCFLEGVQDGTYGNPTNSIFGMDAGDGIMRHPTPLYEIIALIGIWLLLGWLKKYRTLRQGELFKLFMVLYLSWRIAIEFIKPVHVVEPFHLSSIQLACLFGLGYYYKMIRRLPSIIWQRETTSTSS